MYQYISTSIDRKDNIHYKICFYQYNFISMAIECFSHIKSLLFNFKDDYLRTRTKEDIVTHHLEATRFYQLLHFNLPPLHNSQNTGTHLQPSSCIDTSQNTMPTLATEISGPFERIIEPWYGDFLKYYSIYRPYHQTSLIIPEPDESLLFMNYCTSIQTHLFSYESGGMLLEEYLLWDLSKLADTYLGDSYIIFSLAL